MHKTTEEMLEELSKTIANNEQKIIKQKKIMVLRISISLLTIITITLIGSLQSTNQTLKQQAHILRVQSAPSYQHVNTITYPDPVCLNDGLTVVWEGKPVCGVI